MTIVQIHRRIGRIVDRSITQLRRAIKPAGIERKFEDGRRPIQYEDRAVEKFLAFYGRPAGDRARLDTMRQLRHVRAKAGGAK